MSRTARTIVWAVVGACAVAFPSGAVAQHVRFNHLTSTTNATHTIGVGDNEAFTVAIDQTCPAVFDYTIEKIERRSPEDALTPKAGGKVALPPLQTHNLTIVHEERYSGYTVSIVRKSHEEECQGSDKLDDREIVINTPGSWDLSFSGGFTMTSLRNRSFYLRPHPSDAAKKQVQEDLEASDDVNLGIATFVHLYHHRMPLLAGTFGLGIRDGNKTEYFLGGGLRFNDKATLNAGLVLGPVLRLPSGVNTTDPITDDNVLNDLPTRVQKGFFVGISYSFINVSDKLKTPFGGTQPTGTTSAAAAPGRAAAPAAACNATLDNTALKFPQAGNTQTINVTALAPAKCTWRAETNDAWVTVNPTQGTGVASEAVTITVAANPLGKPRTGVVIIGGTTVNLTQAQ